jgi:hypothetical protein
MMLGQWRIKVFFLHQENLPFCNSWCKMDGDGRNVGSPESRASRRKNIPSKGLQRYSWDCGIACVYMILGFKRRLNSGGSHVLSYSEFLGLVIKDRRREHQKASKSNSFWTIDLALILTKFKARCSYFTMELQVNPSYGNMVSSIAFVKHELELSFRSCTKETLNEMWLEWESCFAMFWRMISSKLRKSRFPLPKCPNVYLQEQY